MPDDDLLTERLLRVIDEGRRTATYKLALLLALIDAAALAPGASTIRTRDLAASVLAVYYPQTRVYVANDGIARELRQISMTGSGVLRSVLRLRIEGDNAGARNVAEVRRRLPDEYERTLDVVEETFVRYPIPLQDGSCFYCGDRLAAGAQVDHFLAWSRWPNDAVENLVLADRCNGDKREHLVATLHLDRWVARCDAQADDLVAVAASAKWISDPPRTRALVRSTYLHVAPGTPLWVERDQFVQADGPIAV